MVQNAMLCFILLWNWWERVMCTERFKQQKNVVVCPVLIQSLMSTSGTPEPGEIQHLILGIDFGMIFEEKIHDFNKPTPRGIMERSLCFFFGRSSCEKQNASITLPPVSLTFTETRPSNTSLFIVARSPLPVVVPFPFPVLPAAMRNSLWWTSALWELPIDKHETSTKRRKEQ